MNKRSAPEKKLPCPITLSSMVLSVILLYLLTTPTTAFAQSMENGSYRLRLNPVYQEKLTPTPIQITENAPSPTPSPQPVRSIGKSTVAISDTLVDFGALSPTNPVIRSINLSFQADHFPFFLYQNFTGSLRTEEGNQIPSTTCDNGSCSTSQASVWNSTLTFGIGVSCRNLEGKFCPSDFSEANTFRPLTTEGRTTTPIASGLLTGNGAISLTYKLIVPGTQPPGSYGGSLEYILTPSL